MLSATASEPGVILAVGTWLTAVVLTVERIAQALTRFRRERLALTTWERCRGATGDPATDIAKILTSLNPLPAPDRHLRRRPPSHEEDEPG